MRIALVTVASELSAEQAGMLRELLRSAGITAFVRNEMLAGMRLLEGTVHGASLVVSAVEAERATAIVHAAGVLPGKEPEEPVEIPEEEWRAAANAEDGDDE